MSLLIGFFNYNSSVIELHSQAINILKDYLWD